MLLKETIKRVLGGNGTIKIMKPIKSMRLKNKSSKAYSIWKKNNSYKDIHKGKRCFILGNGPSLKDIDLSLLQDEFVFTVNNFSKVSGFEKVKPDYHLWIDGAFFAIRTDMYYDMKDVMVNYQKMSKLNPVCFVPVDGYEFIKKHKLDKILDIHYIYSIGSIEDININEEKCDISSFIPGMRNVVQYAIIIALYMGFDEIYLLGCDSTSIVTTINCALKQKNDEMHAYDNDNTEKEISGLLQNWDMSDVFYDQYLLFLGYKKINEYCKKRNIKLVNCSSTTLISSIPREDISSVLKRK